MLAWLLLLLATRQLAPQGELLQELLQGLLVTAARAVGDVEPLLQGVGRFQTARWSEC